MVFRNRERPLLPTRARLAFGSQSERAVPSEDALEPATVLVIGLQTQDDQVSRIMGILRQLEIPAALGPTGAGAVAVRVPADRVVAAVLALEQHGFLRVRAYGETDPSS
jgi:hypothetical protein